MRYGSMRLALIIFLTLGSVSSYAEQPVEVVLHDPWRADPFSDVVWAIEHEKPYLLRLQILGVQPIPGIRPKEQYDCWVSALEIRHLTGFSDVPDYRARTMNTVLRIYGEMFNHWMVRELRARGQSPCED